MNNTSTIGFIQIEIRNSEGFTISKISNGIEKMFDVDSNIFIGKSVQECISMDSHFSQFLLQELENSYKSLISHSESFSFERSFVDSILQQKYLCHLTLHPKNSHSVQFFDITVINVSFQSKNIFILEEILERTSSVVGQDFFDTVVMLFHDFFGVTASYIGFFKQNNTKNFLYSFAKDGILSHNIEIDLGGTTCELVLQQGEVTIETDVEKYVKPSLIPLTFKREAFVGQPIVNHIGEYVGLIGVQHETKIQDTSLIRSIMRILAPRTFAEHSRLSAHNLLIDKNRYYQYILENVSSPIIATNSEGIIQNVTNSVLQLLGLSRNQILGNSIGAIFSLNKQLFEQTFFFKILISNINTLIVAKVFTKNPTISELIFETQEFHLESGEKEYIFTIMEKNTNDLAQKEIKDLEYFVREAKILELRTILLELQQSQSKHPLENIDNCLKTVSKALSLEYSGYWSMIENGLKCERFFEVLEYKFNEHLEGFLLNDSDYGEYLQYFRSLKEPSIIYDVYTNPITKVFKNYFVQFGIEFMVEIPIWINGEIKGMFCVEGKDTSRRFEEYEIAFLSAVSLIVSQGLHQSTMTSHSPKKQKLQESILFAFHSIKVPFIILDTNSLVILEVNESWATTFNYHKDAIIGLTLYEINFFKHCRSHQRDEVEELFVSNVALHQHSFVSIDNLRNESEFLLTSTHFTLDSSTAALFFFQPVQKEKSLNLQNDSIEKSSSNVISIAKETKNIDDRKEYSLESFSEQTLLKFSTLIEEKNLSFSVYIDEDLKKSLLVNAENVKIVVDALMNNALTNTHIGFVSLSFNKKNQKDGIDVLVIEVKDSGIGMSEEQVSNIIDSFSQSNKQNSSGLATVRDIVVSFEGTISIDSMLNKGTTMIIEIPLKSVISYDNVSNVTNETNSITDVEENSINIRDKMFLVQRNAKIDSEQIELLLTQFGALTYFTHSFVETKEVSEFIQFECILLFIQEWNEDDISLLTSIQERSLNQSTPIIAVTTSKIEDESNLDSVAIEIIPYSSSFNQLLETLEILFPKEESVHVENFD